MTDDETKHRLDTLERELERLVEKLDEERIDRKESDRELESRIKAHDLLKDDYKSLRSRICELERTSA